MKTLPAFPTDPSSHNECDTGMTLRDYFAAKAMQSVIATVPHDVQIESPYELAAWSYAMADEMLEARIPYVDDDMLEARGKS